MSGLPGGTTRRAAAAEEAVALCRRLAADRPNPHRVDLARALVARAAVPDAQSAAEAIEQLREAIGYVADPPDRAALVVLAAARERLAANLSELGETREALPLALRARATWDAAAPLGPDERMRLAGTLLVIGDCQARLGRPEQALDVRRQARDLHQALSRYQQSRWASLGATAAIDLARSEAAAGRVQEALALLDPARDDLGFLRLVQPPRGRELTADALLVEAECRAELGETEAAVRAAGEATGRLRRLVGATPGARRGHLAAALRVHGQLLLRSGRREEGADRVAEAVEVARGADDGELARALTQLAAARIADRRWDAVEPLLDELLPVCRRWTGDLPEEFRPMLVQALLLVLAMTAFETPGGDPGPGAPPRDRVAGLDGVTAGREAVELARHLATADPQYRVLLGHALFGLDKAVNRAGDVREAAELLRECVALRRQLFAEEPAAHRSDLVDALVNLGNRLHVLGRLDEALPAYEESVALIRAADSGLPPAQAVTPLRNLARTLAALGRTEEAERIAAEAEALAET
ncbi:tetratricopeptide repeat protein [Micromonospora sp. WMMC415]|uniref:tetratricopeptide repeat protein n=1 Tax=Micromonospora sp. WMMC415 TaxID=2675222 RepID=UPI0012B495A3|nr:tetratricopeptide repeat protein [Micromonospora sp. WMMC415]QGN50318.1 tetratricopeptide repeat protein [Micromonospora sp. WMMC415]